MVNYNFVDNSCGHRHSRKSQSHASSDFLLARTEERAKKVKISQQT